jgi:flagellar motor switch protein FliN
MESMKKEGKALNNNLLSQDEIDALLRQGSDNSTTPDSSSERSASLQIRDYLSDFEQDTIGEIGNITFGSAATALSTLLRQKVDITTPNVTVVSRDKVGQEVPVPHVTIRVEYTDGFEGANVLAIRSDDAKIIADLMLGGDGTNVSPELNELHLSAVAEAMNQMMGSASTSMSTLFNKMVNISPPTVEIIDFNGYSMASLFPNDEVLLQVSFRLIVGDLIDSHIMQLIPLQFAKELIVSLTGYVEPKAEVSTESTTMNSVAAATPTQAAPQAGSSPQVQPSAQTVNYQAEHVATGPLSPDAGMYQMQTQSVYGQTQHPYASVPMHHVTAAYQGMAPQAAMYGNQEADTRIGTHVQQESKHVQVAQFSPLEMKLPANAQQGNLDLLLDIPLSITVELGRTKKLIREILELTPGSIIELDKLAGEPVDILINNKLIAKGEVVVIDENFGVRVTDIISPSERIRKLQ